VLTDDSTLIFARKLLRPFAMLSEDEILNEFRAIKKLCLESCQENLVAVYRYGKLPGSPYYYIDMELCDLNLQEYIYEFERRGFSSSFPPLDTTAVFQIMRDVSGGLAFIHERKEVHRDIKPNNSSSIGFHSLLIHSIVLFQRRGLEDR
jgi:serine/threonine protein kinase